MKEWKPGPVVWAVAAAGLVGVWVVVALRLFYELVVSPIDVAFNIAIFMTVVGMWTDWLEKRH